MGSVHEVFYTAKNIGQLECFLNHYPHPTLKEFINAILITTQVSEPKNYLIGEQEPIFLKLSFFLWSNLFITIFLNLGFLDGPAGFYLRLHDELSFFLVRAKLYQFCHSRAGGNPDVSWIPVFTGMTT